MPIRLDERLTAISNLVDHGTIADIGADHGKLSYYLISQDIASHAIATDISKQSLKKAEELAFNNGVTDLLETRLGDGLKPLASNEVDTVIIAGLGGDVIKVILDTAQKEKKEFKHFIISSNTHVEKVREELNKCGHKIIKDISVYCAGKNYSIIKTEIGEQELTEKQILFGVFYKVDPIFKNNAIKEIALLKSMLISNPKAKGIEERIKLLEDAVKENNENN